MPQSSPPPKDALAAGLVVKPVKTSPVSQRQARPVGLPWRQWGQQWGRLTGLTLLLAGAGTLIGLSVWTSVIVILRPQPPRWLAQHFPGLMDAWSEIPTQTTAEIEAELVAQQRSAGDWLALAQISDRPEFADLQLLPIWATRSPCSQDCEAIVELRLYRQAARRTAADQWQLLHQLPVQGPTEATLLQALALPEAGALGSTYQLPLTALKPLHDDALPGAWLTLTGRWQPQGSPILYGQMLYVNPQFQRLTSLLNWQSPPGRLPTWHNVDQQGAPELLVNQTYGLEPDFQLYRVGNLQAVGAHTRLEEITLKPLTLPTEASAIAYQNALFLAQRGLWSAAHARLTQLKTQLADDWSDDLEQQWQLVYLHSRFSTAQAERDWSQPSQKLLALLLDGQWQGALQPIQEKSSGFPKAVLPLLERDFSRIWPRLTASLQVEPNDQAARLWHALLLLTKEDEAAALKWLATDQNSPLRQEFAAIAQTVTNPEPAPTIIWPTATDEPAESAIAPTTPALFDGLIGEATPVANPNFQDWQRPTNGAALTLSPGQQWFTITLESGHQQQQWQPIAFSARLADQPPSQLWQTLGLGASATLRGVDVAGKNPQTLEVIGVRWRGQQPTLLARGGATDRPLFVTTPGQWQSIDTVNPTGLAGWLESQSATSDRLFATLQNHLGFAPDSLATTLQQQANAVPPWATVRPVNLIGGNSSTLILTLSPELLASQGLAAAGQQPTELIMTAQGELLYSSLWSGSGARLAGWIQPASQQPVLVINEGDRPQFLFWSPQNRRFQ
ncbi:hypothetical protein [Leptolyngbya iicbica]|uniref:Uncharacterized protein n=2 Tax=Cyanophyceae TaxID=3028117 RepID=A0A4Q7ECL3_9CYAN|nr:hypothetical protein [Leptolyngbya sp. LK]RZM78975.1 hypothetical protein DYY88_09365 [Leptolyngbya sp. LK]